MAQSPTVREIEPEPASGWATGAVLLAATIMILAGIFQAIQGLAAIIDDDFFVAVDGYAFDLNVTAWGWIHLVLGIVVALTGFYLLTGRRWAGVITIVLAVLIAIQNLFFIPYFSIWSILTIAIALWVIWALTRPGTLESL